MASKKPWCEKFYLESKVSKDLLLPFVDHWLISNDLQDLVISTDICPAIKTDHAAIIIEVGSKDNQEQGLGLWKMSTTKF